MNVEEKLATFHRAGIFMNHLKATFRNRFVNQTKDFVVAKVFMPTVWVVFVPPFVSISQALSGEEIKLPERVSLQKWTCLKFPSRWKDVHVDEAGRDFRIC